MIKKERGFKNVPFLQYLTSYFTSVSNLLSEESNWGKGIEARLAQQQFLHVASKTHLSISPIQKHPRHQQALFAISPLILHQDLQYWISATKEKAKKRVNQVGLCKATITNHILDIIILRRNRRNIETSQAHILNLMQFRSTHPPGPGPIESLKKRVVP